MVDFSKLTQRIEENRKIRIQVILKKFGYLADPPISSLCSRCKSRYGDHYEGGDTLYCPDEWIAEGHQLSP